LIGTNDVWQDYALDIALDRLSASIDQITSTLPECRVLVASIPPVADPVMLRRVQAYNAALVEIARSKGPRVSYVDAFSALDAADLDPDGVHLRASGNSKLARVWHAAIRTILAP
jgi:lysophospholipase L1-like esterase